MIFIVGNSRSGTTMLGRIFDLNSKVHTFDELHFFEQLISAEDLVDNPLWPQDKLIQMAERLITSSRDGLFMPLTKGQYRDEALTYISKLSAPRPIHLYRAILDGHAAEANKTIPLEQTPRYLFLASEILERFPDSHMINMVRDPRDVMLSQKNRWRVQALKEKGVPWIWTVRSWSNYHPVVTAKLWSSAVRMAQSMADHPRFHSISYEELLQSPEPVLRKLCNRIGIPFEPEMLQVSQIGSSLKSDAPERQGLDQSRMGAWKKGGLSKSEVQICEDIAGHAMAKQGYEPSSPNASALKTKLLKASFPFKLVIAGLANLNRLTDLRQGIARRLR